MSAQDGRSFGQSEAGLYDKVGRGMFIVDRCCFSSQHCEVSHLFFKAVVGKE